MSTTKAYAHSNLASFVESVIESAQNGDFFDASKWPRHFFGNRAYSSFPNVDLTTSKTKPAGSGLIAEEGDSLYSSASPKPFGVFLNDLQVAVAEGGPQAGKNFKGLQMFSHRTKPFITANVVFEEAPVIDLTVVKADLTVEFEGVDGEGTATVTTKPAHTTTRFSKATALSNGDTTTVTVTAADGYTVNGKASDTFQFTVSGLTDPEA